MRKKMQKKKIYIYAAFTALLAFGCTELQRDNPFDPDGVNYAGSGEPIGGGSSAEGDKSSSSVEIGGAEDGSSSSVASDGTDETVTIGNQIWMKRNLNIVPATGNSACYNNQASNCNIYGRLYDWATAMALPSSCNSSSCENQINSPHRGICPEGWHIPSDYEWMALTDAVGSYSIAGRELKATEGWNDCGTLRSGKSYVCNDALGFAALPGGYCDSDGSFSRVGYYGAWWSASERNEDIDIVGSLAAFLSISYNYGTTLQVYDTKHFFFSVRCLKD